MWESIPDIIKAITAVSAVIAGTLRYHPARRVWGLLSAAVERQTYQQMAEHQEKTAQWWRRQAEQCQDQLGRMTDQCGRE